MFAPMESRNRMIFTIWTAPVRKKLKLYLSPEAIAEFFPISLEDAAAMVGPGGYREMDNRAVDELAEKLETMFSSFREKEI